MTQSQLGNQMSSQMGSSRLRTGNDLLYLKADLRMQTSISG